MMCRHDEGLNSRISERCDSFSKPSKSSRTILPTLSVKGDLALDRVVVPHEQRVDRTLPAPALAPAAQAQTSASPLSLALHLGRRAQNEGEKENHLHNCDALPDPNLKVEILEDLHVAPARVLEPHVLEADRATARGVDYSACVRRNRRMTVEQVEDSDTGADAAHDRRLRLRTRVCIDAD